MGLLNVRGKGGKMALRFRKSFKIAPGVKLNLNKKSTSITFGTRGAHYTINSKGKRTKSIGIPGTGISYVETSGSKTSSTSHSTSNTPQADSNFPDNDDKKNKGCLVYLLYFILILAAIILSPILWLPGIFITIFFAIRKNPDKKKKRKHILISGCITLVSLILCINLPSTPDLEKLHISLDKKDFAITEKPSITLDLSPKDANISSLDLSDNDIASVKYKNGKAILTFKNEGSADIYLIANDSIKSNKEKITVTDPDKEAKRKQAEQEARQKAEEEARIQAEQEAKQKAEEEARIQAEQETQNQTSSQQQVQTGETVYWVASGDVYHSTPNCPSLSRSKNIYSGSISESGKSRPCKVCH